MGRMLPAPAADRGGWGMPRTRLVRGIALALLTVSTLVGNASGEPRLFDARVTMQALRTSLEALTISNAGRIASVTGSDPASFEVGAGVLGGALTRTGTLAGYPATTSFSFANGAGSFFAGAGPGTAAFTPQGSHPGFRASFSGDAQFGGTLRLLGTFALRWADATPLWQTIADPPLSPVGGSFGGTGMDLHGGTGGFTHTTLWGFPWTTGAVTAMGTTSSGAVVTTAGEGSDQRTSAGQGTIQFVAPVLVRRRFDLEPGIEGRWPLVATLTLHFVPEPAASLLLLCGLAGLVLLSHFSRRSGDEAGASRSCLTTTKAAGIVATAPSSEASPDPRSRDR